MDTECPKCGSQEVIPSVEVMDRSDSGVQSLSLLIAEKPQAAVFRGWRKFPLSARVCPACGYTELYVSDPRGVQESHERASQAPQAIAPVVGATGGQTSQFIFLAAALGALVLVGLGAVVVLLLVSR
jgi:predicted RNA-binding Zn-ribbon protein involved in translation (DUF1610 family)